MSEAPFPPGSFRRIDESDDRLFYLDPRKVVHIDEGAIEAAGRLYGEVLPQGGRLLDLMSSWRSHLPAGFRAAEVVGLGMNAQEMADNPQLTGYIVHDLNRDPRLPFDDASFDGAICTVSVQYLTRPVEVFQDVNRILRPGAPFVVTFSNRCFPTKAVAAWHARDDMGHFDLVGTYFDLSGGWDQIRAEDRSLSEEGDPLYTVWARKRRGPEAS